jgi:hypothetical protein
MINKLGIVEEEADGCLLWQELLVRGEIASPSSVAPLQREADEIVRIMVASIKRLRSAVREDRAEYDFGFQPIEDSPSKIQNPQSKIQ